MHDQPRRRHLSPACTLLALTLGAVVTLAGCQTHDAGRAGSPSRPVTQAAEQDQQQHRRMRNGGVPISISYGHVKEGRTYYGFVIAHGTPNQDMDVDIEIKNAQNFTVFPSRITIQSNAVGGENDLQFHVFRVDTPDVKGDFTIEAEQVGGPHQATSTLIVDDDDGDDGVEE